MGEGAYRFAIRPAAVAHAHPVLVFDHCDRLHLPLTQFAKDAHARVSTSTALAYVRSLLPFFTELDTRGGSDGPRWNGPPAEVRRAVDDYLVRRLRCHVRAHRAGFQLVAITAGTRSTVRVFLSALKLFYRTMQTTGMYAFPHPLGSGHGYGGAGRRAARRRRRLAPDARHQRRRSATPNAAPLGQLLQTRRRRLAPADRG